MTLIAIVEAVALVATVVLFLRHVGSLESAWAEERRELLNRVQAPQHIPVRPAAGYVVPEQEPDEWNLVGTINYGDPDDEPED